MRLRSSVRVGGCRRGHEHDLVARQDDRVSIVCRAAGDGARIQIADVFPAYGDALLGAFRRGHV